MNLTRNVFHMSFPKIFFPCEFQIKFVFSLSSREKNISLADIFSVDKLIILIETFRLHGQTVLRFIPNKLIAENSK